MTIAVSPPPGRRAVGRGMRLMLALFLVFSAWATTHVDDGVGDHEGTAHTAFTVGSLMNVDDAPTAGVVPPVEADATSVMAVDGTTAVVLAAVDAVARATVSTVSADTRAEPSLDPPPPRHPLLLHTISRT